MTESGGTLIFNSKQLEELEHMHDSTGSFEEESEDSGTEDVGEAAMEWRRGLLEEATENVKRSKGRPVDPNIIYDAGSLLYDRESRRFGRVNRSVPGYLRIVYLTGGDREYGLLDVAAYLKEFAPVRKVSELARQLGTSAADVERELDRLDLTALDEEGSELDNAAVDDEDVPSSMEAAPVAEAKTAKKKASKKTTKKAASKAGAKKAEKATSKASAKKADGEKTAKKTRAKKAPPPAKKGGKKANAIDDPNTFIRQNYEEMSNRELARHTGLSEHTIRRKLGEWSLRRKKKA